jgi:DNA mismatch repair ATPase MutL
MISFEQVEPTDEILLEYKVKKSAANANLTNESNVIENADDKEGEKENEQNNDTIHKKDNFGDLFQIEGFVSNCSHGLGRSTPDRQYIYVNKRPCDHSRLTKLMNEIYHQFNRNQYPMFILNINLDSHNVDVNVTPDKLQMFIKSENILLAIVKSSLQKMFSRLMENISLNDSSFQCQKSTMLEFFTSSSASTTKNSQMSKGNFKQLANETKEKADNSMIYQKRPRDEEDTSQLPKQPKLNNFLGLKKDKNSSYSPRKYSPAKNSPTRESPFKNSPPAPPSPHTNDTFTKKE